MTDTSVACRLYVVVEPAAEVRRTLAAVLRAADVASCLIRPGRDGPLSQATAKPLVDLAQRHHVAALIADNADLARVLGADGIHLSGGSDLHQTYAAARRTLGPNAIVGVDAGTSRHDAMTVAEAGADYLAFGAPAHLRDRDKARARRDELIAWWAEIFEVPCVAFDVETHAEAEALVAAGADFIAASLPASSDDATAFMAEISTALGTALPAQ